MLTSLNTYKVESTAFSVPDLLNNRADKMEMVLQIQHGYFGYGAALISIWQQLVDHSLAMTPHSSIGG